MRRTSAEFLLYFFAFILLTGAGAPSSLQTEIDRLNKDAALSHGSWGCCVLSADSGKLIASNNPSLSLMPASTMKILTTGAALGLLGEDFRYETIIGYDGSYDSLNGIVRGNIYIKGSGDPSFASDHFPDTNGVSRIVKAFAARGIKKIEGDIIGDGSCFSENPLPDGWTWGDIGQYYGGGTSGLAYKGNKVVLHFNSTKGDSCILERTDPLIPGVQYYSLVKADGKKDEAFVYGAPYGNLFYIYGSIPAQRSDYEVEAANPEPALHCARDLKEQLSAAGISVSGNETTVRLMNLAGKKEKPAKLKNITTIRSPKLADIVAQTNIHSDNVYAEQLLRTLGMLKGEGGTTEAGVAVVKSYWQSLGVNLDGLNMTDGSGLSRSNLVTTEIQANILQKISRQKWFAAFDKSLPVAGKNGSMAGLCKGTCAESNMRAKTGYINRARGYAGYVKTKSGKLLCFSVLANNYTCTPTEMKKKLEKILVAMAELP